jgi:FkbM family methyltransferase
MTTLQAAKRHRWARLFQRDLHRDHRFFRKFPAGDYRVVLDVGAHTGDFARRVSRYFQPDTICMVEADPELAAALTQKFTAVPGCKVVAAAMSDRIGEIEFRDNEHRASSSLLPASPQLRALFHRSFDEVAVVKVPAITLDELFVRERWTQVDLMKVDIQGGERALLAGGGSTLTRVRVIYIEVLFQQLYENCALFCELHEKLTRDGFHLQFLDDFRPSQEGDLIYGNACYRRG